MRLHRLCNQSGKNAVIKRWVIVTVQLFCVILLHCYVVESHFGRLTEFVPDIFSSILYVSYWCISGSGPVPKILVPQNWFSANIRRWWSVFRKLIRFLISCNSWVSRNPIWVNLFVSGWVCQYPKCCLVR